MIQMIISEFGSFPAYHKNQTEPTKLQEDIVFFIAKTYGASINPNTDARMHDDNPLKVNNLLDLINTLYSIQTNTKFDIVSTEVIQTKSGKQIATMTTTKQDGIHNPVTSVTSSEILVEGSSYGSYIVDTLIIDSYLLNSSPSRVINTNWVFINTTSTSTRAISKYTIEYNLFDVVSGNMLTLNVRYEDSFDHLVDGRIANENSKRIN